MLRLTEHSSYTLHTTHTTTFVHCSVAFLQLQSFLCLVVRVVRVQLVGVVVQVSFGPSARVAGLMSLMGWIVRVTLVGMVVQVSFSASARVSSTSTARHDDQIMAARAIVQ